MMRSPNIWNKGDAIIDGVLDEDLYQELSIILLKAISLFRI